MAIIKATDVAYPTLQCPDLDIQEQFLVHFGMHTVLKTDDTLIMRGDGPQQFIEICKKGEKKFISTAFNAGSMDDLEKLSQTDSFSDIEELTTPGGGYVTKAQDPDGIGVEVVFGIKKREIDELPKPFPTNEGGQINRVNQLKRFNKGDTPRIIRFGHYGINSLDIEKSLEWYHEHLGIIASDILQPPSPPGEEPLTAGIFARLDKGSTPTDHHSIFWLNAHLVSEGIPGLNHVSFEMLNIDDVFMGHELLKRKAKEHDYELEWGVGRHYQGSQIFDYWRSPFKQVHEHQTDGDYLDNTIPPQIVNPMSDGDPDYPEFGPSQWGAAISETFGNKEGT